MALRIARSVIARASAACFVLSHSESAGSSGFAAFLVPVAESLQMNAAVFSAIRD